MARNTKAVAVSRPVSWTATLPASVPAVKAWIVAVTKRTKLVAWMRFHQRRGMRRMNRLVASTATST